LFKSTVNFNKEHLNIIFTKADKGNITVTLERELYIKKMEELLGDTYTKIKKNPMKNLEKTLNNFLKR